MKLLIKISIGVIFIFNACDFGDKRLILRNETEEDLYFRYSCDSLLDIEEQGILKNSEEIISNEFLPADTFINVLQFGVRNGWKRLLVNECNNELYIFFFSPTIIENSEWKDIVDNKLYIEKKRITYSELKKSNWVISYH